MRLRNERLRRADVVDALCAAALIAFALLVFVPWRSHGEALTIGDWRAILAPPATLGEVRIDRSYVLALIEIQRLGLNFGSEVIFTYGPLGFLHSPLISPGLVVPALVARTAFAVVFAVACWRLIRGATPRPSARAASTIAFLAFFLLIAEGRHDVFWYGFALLAAVFHIRAESARRPGVLPLALIVCAAFASLIKFSYAVVALAAVGTTLLFDLRRRTLPILAGSFAASLVAAWFVAGQRPDHLLPWMFASVDLSLGYTDAMAKGFVSPYTRGDIVAFYGAVALPLVAYVVMPRPAPRGREVEAALLATFAAFLFVDSKHAWGGNQLEDATTFLVFVALCYAMLAPPVRSPRGIVAAVCLVIGATGAMIVLARYDTWTKELLNDPARATAHYVGAKARAAASVASGDVDAHRAALEREHRRIRALARLPATNTSTDAYPDYAGVAVATAENAYRPRPMFLSINAHTERLAERNRDFLRSARAPERILFEVFVYPALPHDRLPALADGLSWPDLISRYRLARLTGDFVVLERRERPLRYRLEPLGEREVALGEQVPIPAPSGGLVWAEVDVSPTPLGQLVGVVYKRPPLQIVVGTRERPEGIFVTDGQTRAGDTVESRFRLVPAIARAGFLVSPLVTSNTDFLLLVDAAGARDLSSAIGRVRYIRIEGLSGSGTHLFRRHVRVRVYALRYEAATRAVSSTAQRLIRLRQLQDHFVGGPFEPELRVTSEGRAVLFAHAPSAFEVPVPPEDGQRTLSVRFGFAVSASVASLVRSDGAEFRIFAIEDGSTRVLWRRFIRPRRVTDLVRERTASIRLPRGVSAVRLEIRAGQAHDNAYDHTYWSDVTLSRARR